MGIHCERHERVGVVVLNWNGSSDTIECLRSVAASNGESAHLSIYVVDNGSAAHDVARIEHAIRALDEASHNRYRVNLIKLSRNEGYARGNNAGIRAALNDDCSSIFILNNDATVRPETIPRMIHTLRTRDGCGLVGPAIKNYGTETLSQWPVKKVLSWWGMVVGLSFFKRLFVRTSVYRDLFETGDQVADVYAVPGSAMLFDAQALKSIGLFDPTTFLYWEEFIVAHRLRQLGYLTTYDPHCSVTHKLGVSTQRLGARKSIFEVASYRYFLTQVAPVSRGELILLLGVRLVGYSVRCRDVEFRHRFFEFLQVLLGRPVITSKYLAGPR